MTQQSLATVQNQVSTGLKVATAADNSSYWSIAAQLTADSGVVSASNDALSQGQSLLATASSAINSVITTINSIQTALTQATEPGANIGNINTSLASLGKQLTDAVNAASFNGLNVLNGSVASLNFVSGFNASATGGSINTISFTTQALYGLDHRSTSKHRSTSHVQHHRRNGDQPGADPVDRLHRQDGHRQHNHAHRDLRQRPRQSRTRPIRP